MTTLRIESNKMHERMVYSVIDIQIYYTMFSFIGLMKQITTVLEARV